MRCTFGRVRCALWPEQGNEITLFCLWDCWAGETETLAMEGWSSKSLDSGFYLQHCHWVIMSLLSLASWLVTCKSRVILGPLQLYLFLGLQSHLTSFFFSIRLLICQKDDLSPAPYGFLVPVMFTVKGTLTVVKGISRVLIHILVQVQK